MTCEGEIVREKKAVAQGPWTGRGGFRFSGFGSWMVVLNEGCNR